MMLHNHFDLIQRKCSYLLQKISMTHLQRCADKGQSRSDC